MYLLCYLPSYYPKFCLGDPPQLVDPSRHVLIILTPSGNGLDSRLSVPNTATCILLVKQKLRYVLCNLHKDERW